MPLSIDLEAMGLCQEALDDISVCAMGDDAAEVDEGPNAAPGSPQDNFLSLRRGFRSSPNKLRIGKGNNCNIFFQELSELDRLDASEGGWRIDEDAETFAAKKTMELANAHGICQKMLDDMAVSDEEVSDEGSGPPSPMDSLLFVRRRRTLAEEVQQLEKESLTQMRGQMLEA